MKYDFEVRNKFGDTNAEVQFNPDVFQGYSDTCAIQSQKLILEKYGVNISQEDLIREATENGWYTPNSMNGTQMSDVGKLLECHGVEVVQSSGNNIFSLAHELAQGHQVIVGVDSGELWNKGSWYHSLEDFFLGEVPDHALIVSGLDVSDPSNVQVVLTDPGTGQERVRYGEKEFLDAWKDSNCWMMSTESAPPSEYCFWGTYDHCFAGIPQDTLARLGACDFDVRSEGYDDFIVKLQETPEMGWEEIIEMGMAVLTLVKMGMEVVDDIAEPGSGGLAQGMTFVDDTPCLDDQDLDFESLDMVEAENGVV